MCVKKPRLSRRGFFVLYGTARPAASAGGEKKKDCRSMAVSFSYDYAIALKALVNWLFL